MRWPIRYQILMPLAGIVLAAVLTVSLLNAYWAASRTSRQIEDQLREVARTLSASNFPLTEKVLGQMHGLAGAEFVLSDGSGRVQATSGLRDAAVLPTDAVADRWQDLRLGPTVSLAGARYFHTVLKADRHGAASEPGLLHILYPERVLRDARRQAMIPPLAVGAVALALCVALAGLIARKLSRPIVEIRTQVGRLAHGDFRPVAVPARNDELRDLATSVNELARQLDELRRAIARAERLSLLGRLSGGLAHHMRNDVAGALMAVQLHQRHCHSDDSESLDVALRQLCLTEEHLKRFLAAGQPQEPRRTTFDPYDLVEELVTLLTPTARHWRVALTGPPRDASVDLHADRDQLRQALLNLLLNALEAAGKNGEVRVELAADDHGLRLRVLDSGPGLTPDVAQRLGEAFVTTKVDGVGLGLAVARQVAEAHGGSLRYARAAETTSFEILLPRGDRQSLPVAVAAAAGAPDQSPWGT
ncbi:MAG: HAMP domain-containing histidine kinase [Planctomycetia bacterium]|nr:HAMP domain-containing histidine kinase [Planctomycetia bacterium]